MFYVPFVPPPYPDEILGSWLARVALYSGRGAWRSLLEEAGFGRRLEGSLFDMAPFSRSLDRLFAALGTTYERSLWELTSLPYWLAFDAASSGSPIPGTSSTPWPINRRGLNQSSLANVGIARSAGEARGVVFCPECLDDDLRSHGEPYWHRTHQLPHVFFCAKHEVALQRRCRGCGSSAIRSAKQMSEAPRLRCPCGRDLRRAPRALPPDPMYLRLGQFSGRALAGQAPAWHGGHVRSHVRHLLNGGGRAPSGGYPSVLSESFGARRTPTGEFSAPVPGNDSATFRCAAYLSLATAPEFCALLTGLGLDFDTAARGFITADSTSYARGQGSQARPSWNVKLARSELVRFVEERPDRLPCQHRSPYTFLRLFDARWLRERFPYANVNRLPSVQEDRADINRRFAGDSTPVSKRRSKIVESAAGLRARYRDSKWLGKLLSSLRSESLTGLRSRSAATLQTRVNALQRAIDTRLAQEDFPARVFANQLGAMVGLSHSQAGDAVRSDPGLRSAIDAANAGKPSRQVAWAISRLREQGIALTKTNVGRRARLPRPDVTRVLAANPSLDADFKASIEPLKT